jgi:hypothetical protein
METTPTNQTPVALIIEQHAKLGTSDFNKWLITNGYDLLIKQKSLSENVSLILHQHHKLNSFEFTKWIISKSNDLIKETPSDSKS